MMMEDAQAVAHTVEGAFRGEDELNDEFLSSDLRSLFYDLQDQGLLEVRRTEYKLDGRDRRAYFWRLREDNPLPHHDLPVPEPEQRLYDRLPDQSWERRRQPYDL